MKKISTILAALLVTVSVFLPQQAGAQSPEKMSYQAVIRDSNDKLVNNQSIGMQISILQGSADGTVVYAETQTPTTNANGLVSVEIGNGTLVSGDFAGIDWANGPYFIKTETDIEGGTNYTIIGTSQLLSVPYALHAKTAESVTGTSAETDPVFTNSQAANITATDIGNLANLSGINTGDQDLSSLATKTDLTEATTKIRSELPDVSGFISSESDPVYSAWDKSTGISITESQITDLTHFTTDDETDPVYSKSVASGISTSDISNWNNKLDTEVDGSITNEIQNLSSVLTEGNDGGTKQIKNIATPTDAGDATTKSYVDNLLAGADCASCDMVLKYLILTENSIEILLNADIPVSNLYEAGKSVSALFNAGVSEAELLSAGGSITEIVKAGGSVDTLLDLGVTISELINSKAGVGVGTLEKNGVTEQELSDAGLIGTVTDVEGNTYKWVKIGEQGWMAENLRTTTFNDSTAINSYFYSWYKNDSVTYASDFGALYFYIDYTPFYRSKLCPKGWHIPDDSEWTELKDYLTDNGFGYGGSGDDIAKSLADTSLWISSTKAGTPGYDMSSNNSSGFSGLPAGSGYNGGTDFGWDGSYARWWSVVEDNWVDPRLCELYTSATYLGLVGGGHYNSGFYIRCVRDE
ncbi:hypothetical protein GM418_08830 [Maribellus comscasis]|uniref:Fibrobacter succinogenes major paralogous domain-containing protein n=1 Tax=Maribellus comscasis TaxID=2681766 RepID=A0A6I6JUB0_9BACT|nr:fibrobacter succinogenes major paralogous domain-containing protein [Maribellus comscasis]QGY43757.1 hypothetical protein GM418_08830 [Maribellus comscasis]